MHLQTKIIKLPKEDIGPRPPPANKIIPRTLQEIFLIRAQQYVFDSSYRGIYFLLTY